MASTQVLLGPTPFCRRDTFNLAGKIVTKSRQLFLVITDEYRFQDVWASVLNNLSELRLEAYP
jgi:hypothetical protein